MKYKSKIDPLFYIIVWFPVVMIAVIALFDPNLEILLTLLFTTIFICWLWFYTFYKISDKHLIVQCGPFQSKIDIETIKSIRSKRTWLSSPALSLDKIEIKYRKYEKIYISPADKQKFVLHLKSINPEIQTDQNE